MDQLKIELKQWENLFISKYGRDPSISDIDKLPDIKIKYKKYSKLKKKLLTKTYPNEKKLKSLGQKYNSDKNTSIKTSKDFAKTPEKFQENYTHSKNSHDKQKLNENNSTFSSNKKLRNDLDSIGPTPQVIGKSISILDLSPIKKNLNLELFEDDETPNQITNGEDNENYMAESSQFLDENDDTIENKNNKDKLGNKILPKPILNATYGPNSPLKLPTLLINNDKIIFYNHNTPKKLSNVTPQKYNNTPNSTQNTISGNLSGRNLTDTLANHLVSKSFISPSPIWKKSLNKSLMELENEYKSIRKELKLIEENENEVNTDEDTNQKTLSTDSNTDKKDGGKLNDTDEDEEDEEGNTETDHYSEEQTAANEDATLVESSLDDELDSKDSSNGTSKYKAKTIKTKRRHVIKRINDDKDFTYDINENINLHAMLRSIKKRKIIKFFHDETIVNDDTDYTLESDNVNQDEEASKPPKKSNRKKKYNLVSNNFRRLKLPRRNNGRKSNWRRR